MKNDFTKQIAVSTVSALLAYLMVRVIDKQFKKEKQVFSNLGDGSQPNFNRKIS